MRYTIQISTLIACTLPAVAVAQVLQPWSAKVKLTVEGDSEVTVRVSSWFTEELRHMQDVDVVDTAPDWEVHVLVFQTKGQSGLVTGYAMSEVVLYRYDPRDLFRTLANFGDTSGVRARVWKTAIEFTHEGWMMMDFRMGVGPTENLRSETEDFAARFDAGQLEPDRKNWDRMRASQRKP